MGSGGNQAEALESVWGWVNSSENNPGIMALVAFLGLLLPVFLVWLNRRSKRKTEAPQFGRGGDGGSASVGGNGSAVGGRGGRGGLFGRGGDGGGSEVEGSGLAIGGDGGDAGLPWRPVFGGASTTERLPPNHWSNDFLPKDELGLMMAGRGGAGGNVDAMVQTGHGMMRLLDLLRLINLWSPGAIDEGDRHEPEDEQAFWEVLKKVHPELALRAERHVVACQSAKEKGEQPPSPYA